MNRHLLEMLNSPDRVTRENGVSSIREYLLVVARERGFDGILDPGEPVAVVLGVPVYARDFATDIDVRAIMQSRLCALLLGGLVGSMATSRGG